MISHFQTYCKIVLITSNISQFIYSSFHCTLCALSIDNILIETVLALIDCVYVYILYLLKIIIFTLHKGRSPFCFAIYLFIIFPLINSISLPRSVCFIVN